ncbi:UdgX family uracil-DNA binding protein [Asaia lannensis]|uniref:Type-4 uracil-DNA glycosylase n=1 Tax=Asaia lannensis NBRC 102526 TaxID=1307926 RepID=A0ABT1CFT8_9PROT|nr:UdgX family uracil-DNA binding protein [Asaia lannensis]MCO6159727.1 UdgX family uracil-DNA binding protein [Asaia lannensis NBRC 102526]GBQ99204.1 uracil-DNA glycosylase [Asaia lannensis NBRC 102526]
MRRIALPEDADFDVWRAEARRALAGGEPPEALDWVVSDAEQAELFLPFESEGAPNAGPSAEAASAPVGHVTKAGLTLLRTILRYRDPARFALAYRLLWRMQSEPALLAIATDPDIRDATRMEHQIRRDMHKMKAFLRFSEAEGDREGRRRFVAWFEPDHFILESVAPFFAERFSDMDWLILTPIGSILFEGGKLSCTRTPCEKPDLQDDVETLWHGYYQSIFNPARIKTKAMRSEMPTKYWKNLPETRLIPQMLANAESRVAAMVALQNDGSAPGFHERHQAEWTRRAQETRQAQDALEGLPALNNALKTCQRCTLCRYATQVVPGTGPQNASLMMIGEQPGDQEDLQGKPFVGPAGQVLDRILEEVGIDREAVFLTNAVKHFKFVSKGRRRIHQTPDRTEIVACSSWLEQEIALVKPRLIVTLGATALQALEGRVTRLGVTRGHIREGSDRRPPSLATIHPSYLLRLPDPQRAREEEQRFKQELTIARDWLAAS